MQHIPGNIDVSPLDTLLDEDLQERGRDRTAFNMDPTSVQSAPSMPSARVHPPQSTIFMNTARAHQIVDAEHYERTRRRYGCCQCSSSPSRCPSAHQCTRRPTADANSAQRFSCTYHKMCTIRLGQKLRSRAYNLKGDCALTFPTAPSCAPGHRRWRTHRPYTHPAPPHRHRSMWPDR